MCRNFAADSHVDRSITGAVEFVRTNAVGVRTLLDAAQRLGVSRFVQVSTDEVYGSRIYNISGGIAMTNRELTERLVSACGRDWSFVEQVNDRLGHDFRYAIDDAKIREELGYAPRPSLEDGLAETVAWFRDNEWWWRPPKQSDAG